MHPIASALPSLFVAIMLSTGQVVATLETKAEEANPKEIKTEIAGVAVQPPFPMARPVDRLPHQLFHPGDIYYPAELAKSGVQGEVKLDIVLSADGKLLSAKIVDSSKSDELDKNALSYVNAVGEKWTLPENHPMGEKAHYLLSIVFTRDSVMNINLKTCAELNTDLSYFRSTNPDEEARKVASLELIASLFTVQLIKTRGAAEALKYAQSIDAISDDTIRSCQEKPDARMPSARKKIMPAPSAIR